MSKKILVLIEKIKEHNEGHGGECGNFAIILNRLLKNKGKYLALYDSIYEGDGLNHVVLEVNGVCYDHSGIISKEEIIKTYGYDEDYDDVIFWITEEEEDRVWLKTDGGCLDEVERVLNLLK